MKEFSTTTIYKISLIAFSCFIQGCVCSCPVLECGFIKESGRGAFSAALDQEKTLLHIRTDAHNHGTPPTEPPSDESAERVYYVRDPHATLCHASLRPGGGKRSAAQQQKPPQEKPQCEMNAYLPQPATVVWATALTEPPTSPLHLQADWFSVALRGRDRQLVLSTVMRAATATMEPDVVLSVSSRTVAVRARLGEPVLLDCQFRVDPSSPLAGAGFAVEWRYQFRGDGRLVLAYDGRSDRLAGPPEDGATLDFAGVHTHGNASLVLPEARVRHSGTYICTVFLPYLLAQVAVDLEIVEPPSLAVFPSPLPLSAPGQSLTVLCEASRFAPLSLDLSWELTDAEGRVTALGPGMVSGHRQAWDGTYSQSSKLQLDTALQHRGGQLTCVAEHAGGRRKASVALNVIGFSSPSIEDSMAMVGVALVLYGLIKLVSWTFSGSGSDEAEKQDKKEN